jgi:hypothetical protein
MKEQQQSPATVGEVSLPEHARRALQEAEKRRRLVDLRKAANPPPREIGGRKGPDPTRYGDWEKNGIASDF